MAKKTETTKPVEAAKPAFDVAVINTAAATMAKADAAYEMAIPAAAQVVARTLGTKPSYDLWEAVAEAFQGAYRLARGCVEATSANRWYAVVKHMADNMELAKPAKPTSGAASKAASRDKTAKAVKAARAQCVKPADAFKKAAELAEQGKVAEAKIYTEAGNSLAKDMAKKSNDASMAKLKKARDAVKASLAKCEDDASLAAAAHILKHGLKAWLELAKKEPAKA